MNYWEKLFHTFAIVSGTAFVLGFTGIAHAAQKTSAVFTVTSVTPMYDTVIQQKPVQSCSVVDIPIYSKKDKTGDIIGGAIIGGILGNNVVKGDGAGAAGAVIGGLLGANKSNNSQEIIGYRQQNRCTTSYTQQSVERLNGYKVVAEGQGLTYETITNQNFKVGDGMVVYITIQR
jgi:uncharacterized protein YcfJ